MSITRLILYLIPRQGFCTSHTGLLCNPYSPHTHLHLRASPLSGSIWPQSWEIWCLLNFPIPTPPSLTPPPSGAGEDSWESLGLQGDQTSQSSRKSGLNIHWKDWCWSWRSNTLATWYEELTHWKRPWCWERLRAGGDEDKRGWDG